MVSTLARGEKEGWGITQAVDACLAFVCPGFNSQYQKEKHEERRTLNL
jgi:hypothetical protein